MVELIDEVTGYPNTVLMSQVQDRGGEGTITGLNGLLLGLARERNLEGVCLLGEIPAYISQFPTIYPPASQSIVEVLARYLGIEIDTSRLDGMIREVTESIEQLYTMIPPEMRERIEHLKEAEDTREAEPDSITEEDKKQIMRDIEQFFDRGSKGD